MVLCPPDCPCVLHSLCIVWWKAGWPCTAVCLCPSHLISVPSPCLGFVHASVHEFMSTWLPMSAPPPMHSLMETWVPLCGIVCLLRSPCLWTHTLFRMCTCISMWIYVHCPCVLHSLCIVWWKAGWPCTAVCLCPSHLISVWTPCLGCVHASVHVCMSTWLPMLAKHPMDCYMERWVPVCGTVCVS